MTAKYVVLEDHTGLEYPFLFSPLMQHDDFVRPLVAQGMKVLGAGFALVGDSLQDYKVSCYDKSVSLQINSRGERDSIVFNSMFKRA